MSPRRHKTPEVTARERYPEASEPPSATWWGIAYQLLVSMRPREWSKNIFVFTALFFSKNIAHPVLTPKACLAFALYCLAAGGVYLLNDLRDCEEDKRHPDKRYRPLASGALPLSTARMAAFLLPLLTVSSALWLNSAFGAITLAYILLNVAYSFRLKHLVILDVFSIAAGFVMRVVAGAVVIDVVMSHWLLVCTMLLALFLGFSKRRCELVTLQHNAAQHRHVLAEYDLPFLDMIIAIVTSATVVGYTLYTVSPETVQRFHTDKLLWTVPIVLYGIFRYLYLVYHRNYGGNPALALFVDRPLLASVLLWGLVSSVVLYTAP